MKSTKILSVPREYREGVKALFYDKDTHFLGHGRAEMNEEWVSRPMPWRIGAFMSKYNKDGYEMKVFKFVGLAPFNIRVYQEVIQ